MTWVVAVRCDVQKCDQNATINAGGEYEAITESPSYVKVLCPPCNRVYGSADLKLKRIERKVVSTSQKMEIMSDQLEAIARKPSYSAVTSKEINTGNHPAALPKNVVEGLKNMTKASQKQDTVDKLKRTRIVVKPGDTSIRTSRNIRKEFNKHHQGIIIKHCRLTASGSVMFEFEDEQTAEAVHEKWSTEYFGGNVGMKIPGHHNTTGMIKHVYDDNTEADMRNDILEQYGEEIEELEFLKRKSDNSFMGMIKVEFKTRERVY